MGPSDVLAGLCSVMVKLGPFFSIPMADCEEDANAKMHGLPLFINTLYELVVYFNMGLTWKEEFEVKRVAEAMAEEGTVTMEVGQWVVLCLARKVYIAPIRNTNSKVRFEDWEDDVDYNSSNSDTGDDSSSSSASDDEPNTGWR